jgi:hypothetical protein
MDPFRFDSIVAAALSQDVFEREIFSRIEREVLEEKCLRKPCVGSGSQGLTLTALTGRSIMAPMVAKDLQ